LQEAAKKKTIKRNSIPKEYIFFIVLSLTIN